MTLCNAMGQSLRLFLVACALGDSDSGAMEKLARWQHEWHITAEAEAKQAIATGFANSMTETWAKAWQQRSDVIFGCCAFGRVC